MARSLLARIVSLATAVGLITASCGVFPSNTNDALLAASGDCDITQVQSLLDNGADPNARDSHEESALVAAASEVGDADDCVVVAGLLLDAGADPNGISMSNLTALSAALLEDADEAMINRLLDGGADPCLHISLDNPNLPVQWEGPTGAMVSKVEESGVASIDASTQERLSCS